MKYRIALSGLLTCLFILSCTKPSKSAKETNVGDYKAPETMSLQFTDPEPFEWQTITLASPTTYSLNIDALPSKPFELNAFKPLKTPMKEYDLDWDNFPTEALKFDSVPFTVTKGALKQPSVTKMKPPGNMEGTNANLLQLSANEGLASNDINCFLETEDGAIWIASASSLIRYDGEHAFTYDYPFVYKITIDQHGRLWMVKPGQSMVLVLDFKNDIEYTITISDNFVPLDILSDHTGTIYIVSIQDGLYKMDPGMKSLQKVANEGTNLSWTLFEDSKDNLWIGFGDRIAIVDKERKELKTFPGNSHFDVNSIVSDIKEDRSGNIWLCLPFPSTANKSFSPSLLRVSLKNQKVRVLNAENGYNILGNTITEDTQGNFWVFGRSEAFILNENTTNFKILGLK
ncbi:ligand-binding sensor domain-containing protein, partial [Muriicola sp.]|uniref:ligand-binding sensor domain-containing protein n=1 Tax=Muriicola sp. TaxID=2020856 RepID=UPI003C7941D1